MLDKSNIRRIKEKMMQSDIGRREIIKYSGDALHLAKRSIFSLHRLNEKEAVQKLAEAEKIIAKLREKFNKNVLEKEGSYKAGLEELVEANLFLNFVQGKKMGKIGLNPPDEVYIAGLCDVPGELLRYAVKAGTTRDMDTVKKCSETAQSIIGELIEFNLTSYLRNKFDQAKNASRKLEQVVYELSLTQK
jgi:predicted translin family RNA/ssDNA-binding protein